MTQTLPKYPKSATDPEIAFSLAKQLTLVTEGFLSQSEKPKMGEEYFAHLEFLLNAVIEAYFEAFQRDWLIGEANVTADTIDINKVNVELPEPMRRMMELVADTYLPEGPSIH